MKKIDNLWYLANDEYEANLNMMYNEVSKIHHHVRPYFFTDHSISHSERIMHHLLKLFPFLFINGEEEHMLSDVEKFILFSSILLHDIGIALIDKEKIKQLSLKFPDLLNVPTDENHINDIYIRNNHHLLSKLWILEESSNVNSDKIELRKAYIGNNILAKYVANVCESHGINFEDSPSHTKTTAYGFERIRMGLLCTLLSLGDALDCDQNRIDYDVLKTSDISVDSRVHWMKHYYVDGIILTPNLINIYYSFPENGDEMLNNLYKEYFIQKTKYWIEKCFTVRKNYIFPIKAICRVVDNVEFTKDKDTLKCNELELIKNEYMKELTKNKKQIDNMIHYLEKL